MTNADKFKGIFGIYVTELWAKPEKEFLEWLNENVPDTNVSDMISRQAAIDAMANAIWHYPNELYRELNQYETARELAEIGLSSLPSAQPEDRCSECDAWNKYKICSQPEIIPYSKYDYARCNLDYTWSYNHPDDYNAYGIGADHFYGYAVRREDGKVN